MAKHKAPPPLSRKHMALAKRERLVSRVFLVSVVLVLAAVIVLVGYGIFEQEVLLPGSPAAIVNGEEITRDELGARMALAQADLLQQRRSVSEMLSLFGDSPDIIQSLQQQVAQIDALLNDPNTMGAQTLEGLIQARLIRQEAARRGIEVPEAEVRRSIEENFGFYAGGTPTAAPTPTDDARLAAQRTADSRRAGTPAPTPTAAPTRTATRGAPATATATATAGPSVTPSPTPTEYTQEGFQAEWQRYLDDLDSAFGVPEAAVVERFADRLYRERLRETFRTSISIDEEQVWAKHILLPDETSATAALARIEAGEPWDEVAAAISLDTGNKDFGGDLGWFARGAMIDAFSSAAFAGEVGEIVGPVQTEFGWHLILIVDHATRRLDAASYESALERAFATWLTTAREEAEIIFDPELVPPSATPAPTDVGTTPSPPPEPSATP